MDKSLTLPEFAPYRTLSSQHYQVAIEEMIAKGSRMIKAGSYTSICMGGWAEYYVARPTSSCTDKAEMKAIMIVCSPWGEITTRVEDLASVCVM